MTAPRWTLATLLALAVAVAAIYFLAIGRAYDRISGGSKLAATPAGTIEFAEGGSGAPVLVIHGSGGGFDQGELIAQAILGAEFRWIAPSRFGYLRSGLPEGATFDDQAGAYAHLLDHLGLQKVAVVALSHGGPSALLFALRHPDRVSSLTLVSCGVASSSDAQQAQANRAGDTLKRIFSYDPLYWFASTLFRARIMQLMGASDEVVSTLTEDQLRIVGQVIEFMNPVEPRSAGVAMDNRARLPNERIAAIRTPTLILHAVDDTLQLYRNAEFTAAVIPGSRLVRFERGGHLLFAVEQKAIRAEAQKFIRTHAEGAK